MVINSFECPRCGDALYSRCKEDTRSCSCLAISIVGGTLAYQPDLTNKVKRLKIKVDCDSKDLYNDYKSKTNKYGLVRAEYGPGFRGKKW